MGRGSIDVELSLACGAGFCLAVAIGVALKKSALSIVVVSLAWAGAVAAQPPGLTPGGRSPHHQAVPPLPYVFSSPMPTLPPPSRNAPFEGTIGFAVGLNGVRGVVNPDGSIDFEGERGGMGVGVDPILGLAALFQFDATDEAMRAARQDPYASEKLRIMDETFEERVAMRAAHDTVVMVRALDDLPNYLGAVWKHRAWSPATRRRILFALWDEAAEDGNEFLRVSGAEARRRIEDFIAHRLPPGSRHAFRPAEIALLNRRRQSRVRFAPYAAALARKQAARARIVARESIAIPAILATYTGSPDAPPALVAALRAL